VKMVLDLRAEDPNDHGIITRVARQLGIGTESLRSRARRRAARWRETRCSRTLRKITAGAPYVAGYTSYQAIQ